MSLMMRTFVVTMMLASASSFAPSPKTQLATRRPAQAPPRVMPAMKVTYRSRSDAERRCCLDPASGATSNPEPASALMRLLPSAPLPALWPTLSLPLR